MPSRVMKNSFFITLLVSRKYSLTPTGFAPLASLSPAGEGPNALLPPGIGIYTIHQPTDSEGAAPSHRNTQLSFPRKRESSIDAGYLDSRLRGNDDLFEMCRYLCPPGRAKRGGRSRWG